MMIENVDDLGESATVPANAVPANAVPANAVPANAGHAASDVLPREFFARPVTRVAPDLLGCVIEHRTADGVVAAMIVETEAYAGSADPASHSFRGETSRNSVMFGDPGHVYVYFTYGMHYCMNLVCQPAGEASAVLLRAGRVIEGADLAAARRVTGLSGGADRLGSGPARLCQALGIDKSHNGVDVCDPAGALTVRAPEESAAPGPGDISCGPRVGVSKAAEVAWRFWITADPAVSAYRRHVPRRRNRI
jgi:DNA-3-methyladenine glycosylase